MANSQDCQMENGEDFSQDVNAENENFVQDEQSSQQHLNGQNGGGDAPPADSGSADAPGRDDDRYVIKSLHDTISRLIPKDNEYYIK